MIGSRLLLLAAILFIATFSVRAAAPQIQPNTSHLPAVPPGTSSADYLGSNACAPCHADAFAQWRDSLHVKMTQPIAEATVLGDFAAGTRFADHDRAYELSRVGGQPLIKVTYGNGPSESFAVDYTLGAKRYQGYLSKLPDGRIYVLPIFWHIESRRWIDWKEITPIPDGAHDLRQIWNTNCFNCHATNLVQGFDVATKKYDTQWTEMGIGCEACHGPGRKHVEMIELAKKTPTLKPGGSLDIFSPRNGTPRQSFDTCAYCHGNKQNVFTGFRGGDRFEDYALPFLISAPIPDNDLQGEFWPDGRPNRFNRPQALTLSGCFKAGQAVCTSCHVAHGSSNPFSLKVDITKGSDGDQLCMQCHTNSSRLSAVSYQDKTHTYHQPASEGSRCVSCHMSDVNWRLLTRRRDHTFEAPVPEMTAAFGVPNACTTCHDNRSPEWAARQMDQWWGDGARRRTELTIADTMYRAGSGDASVLPELARLAIDRQHGMVIRASAVEFIGRLALGNVGVSSEGAQSQTSFADRRPATGDRRLPTGDRRPASLSAAQINALIGAASDPEPTVRAHAINALLATGDRTRAITPIVARLIDPARIVRVRAAEALLSLGIAELPGAAGDALRKAQDEYGLALSQFPDAASNHAALGWLQSERNQMAAATAALDTAIRLDPRIARPLVIKGVIAAREGRYAEAAELWRQAKALEPAYPNIDQLIAEAEKRKAPGN